MIACDPNDEFTASFLPFAQKMRADEAPSLVINNFKKLFEQYGVGDQSYLAESMICPVSPEEIPEMEALAQYRNVGTLSLEKTAIIKLNGGLGTSMGLQGPKSFLPVREGRTFLDLILSQVKYLRNEYDAPLPLVFMNSFWTDGQTKNRLMFEKNGDPHIPMTFLQHRYPRILKKDCSPLQWDLNTDFEWNPAGHGDIYNALLTTGLMRKLLLNGYRYVFVSNSDNLGAVFSPELLGYMVTNTVPFLMEVCRRSSQDRKGGHLMRLGAGGALGLREVAQCDPVEMESFQDIDRYSFFNTNSIWLDLKAVEDVFLRSKEFPLQLIVNPKRAVAGNMDSPEVVQLETAMGSAISLFEGAQAVVVPRSRFSPVKTMSDLLLTMSDCFHVDTNNSVVCAKNWQNLPKISLDPQVYSTVENFLSRFPEGVPSLGDCHELKVQGDVLFQGNIELKGAVSIINSTDKQVIIPPGKNLSGEILVA